MATFSDLPTELRLLIGRHLNVPRLAKLKSLNSFFFNCYLDTRWEQVEIDSRLAFKAVRDLQRMVDPFVATRTKSLIIRLDSADSDTTNILTESLPLLPSINTLNITITNDSASYSSTLLQTIISSSIARTLGKLRLAVSLDTFGPLAEYSFPFENLTVFHLDLDLSSWILSHPQAEFPVAPSSFLRTLAPTLQGLRISDQSTNYDLCPLFNTLSEPFSVTPSIPFPHLSSLILSFSFNNAETLQTSHRSLLQFLLAHQNNLQYLHLKLTGPHSTSRTTPEEKHLGVWLTELTNNSHFSSLQTLGIYPSNTPAGLSAVLTLIKRTAPTMTSLIIHDRLLTYEDVARVLDALTEGDVHGHTTGTSNLKCLQLCVIQLTVPLLNLLATKLWQLERLSLFASYLIGGGGGRSFFQLLERRHYNPDVNPFTQDVLHTWKLQSLSIRIGLSFRPDKAAERAIAGAVPTLARKI